MRRRSKVGCEEYRLQTVKSKLKAGKHSVYYPTDNMMRLTHPNRTPPPLLESNPPDVSESDRAYVHVCLLSVND